MSTFDFNGVQFASFTYTNKQGVVSNYKVILGSLYEKGQKENVEKLKNASFTEQDLEAVRLEMIEKAEANLNPKTRSNQSLAHDKTYKYLHRFIKEHIGEKSPHLNGNIYINAVIYKVTQTEEQKKQTAENIASGNFEPKKETKHGAKVLAKNKIAKALELKNKSFGAFKLAKGSMESARVNGDTIYFD